MDEKEFNRVTLEELALEIAKPLALAAKTREGWEEADAMSLTISTTLHKIGMPTEGLPGVRPHILKMLEEGKIAVRSTRNGLPPVDVSDVTASNFEMWYLTKEDADRVRAHLETPAAAKVEAIDANGSYDWIEEARNIADRIAQKRWDGGQREITARNISDAVATELGNDRRSYGQRGPRTGSSVRKDALRGWKFTPPKGGASGATGAS